MDSSFIYQVTTTFKNHKRKILVFPVQSSFSWLDMTDFPVKPCENLQILIFHEVWLKSHNQHENQIINFVLIKTITFKALKEYKSDFII